MDKVSFGAKIDVEVNRRIPMVKSAWDTVCIGKDGVEKWRDHSENIVTEQGLTAILDVMFMGGTQLSDWYVVLIEDGDAPTSASTYAVPIYTECTDVTNATRPVYTGVQVDQIIDNAAAKAVFTIDTGGEDLMGGALVGGPIATATIGDVASSGAILYCAIEFDAVKPMVASDIISITITLSSSNVV